MGPGVMRWTTSRVSAETTETEMPYYSGDNNANNIDYSNNTYAPSAGWPAHQAWWQLLGLGGDDRIIGSRWNDYIDGGDGSDALFGYTGNDSLYGRNGNDFLYGHDGDDNLNGGAGDDLLRGQGNSDWLSGDDGNDTLEGGPGDDTLIGGIGNDVNRGGSGNDVILDGAGNDILNGGTGNDRLWGGTGNDRYEFLEGGIDVVNDGVNEGGSPRTDAVYDTQDRIVVSYLSNEIELIRFQNSNDLWITSTTDFGDETIDAGVKIEDYYLGGHYTVEFLQTADSMTFNIANYAPTDNFI